MITSSGRLWRHGCLRERRPFNDRPSPCREVPHRGASGWWAVLPLQRVHLSDQGWYYRFFSFPNSGFWSTLKNRFLNFSQSIIYSDIPFHMFLVEPMYFFLVTRAVSREIERKGVGSTSKCKKTIFNVFLRTLALRFSTTSKRTLQLKWHVDVTFAHKS